MKHSAPQTAMDWAKNTLEEIQNYVNGRVKKRRGKASERTAPLLEEIRSASSLLKQDSDDDSDFIEAVEKLRTNFLKAYEEKTKEFLPFETQGALVINRQDSKPGDAEPRRKFLEKRPPEEKAYSDLMVLKEYFAGMIEGDEVKKLGQHFLEKCKSLEAVYLVQMALEEKEREFEYFKSKVAELSKDNPEAFKAVTTGEAEVGVAISRVNQPHPLPAEATLVEGEVVVVAAIPLVSGPRTQDGDLILQGTVVRNAVSNSAESQPKSGFADVVVAMAQQYPLKPIISAAELDGVAINLYTNDRKNSYSLSNVGGAGGLRLQLVPPVVTGDVKILMCPPDQVSGDDALAGYINQRQGQPLCLMEINKKTYYPFSVGDKKFAVDLSSNLEATLTPIDNALTKLGMVADNTMIIGVQLCCTSILTAEEHEAKVRSGGFTISMTDKFKMAKTFESNLDAILAQNLRETNAIKPLPENKKIFIFRTRFGAINDAGHFVTTKVDLTRDVPVITFVDSETAWNKAEESKENNRAKPFCEQALPLLYEAVKGKKMAQNISPEVIFRNGFTATNAGCVEVSFFNVLSLATEDSNSARTQSAKRTTSLLVDNDPRFDAINKTGIPPAFFGRALCEFGDQIAQEAARIRTRPEISAEVVPAAVSQAAHEGVGAAVDTESNSLVKRDILSGEEIYDISFKSILTALSKLTEITVNVRDPFVFNASTDSLAAPVKSETKDSGIDVLPLHNNNGHWVVMIVDHGKKRMVCFDPKGNFPATLGLLDDSGHAINESKVKEKFLSGSGAAGYSVIDACVTKTEENRESMPILVGMVQSQNDKDNCGIFCSRFVELYLQVGAVLENAEIVPHITESARLNQEVGKENNPTALRQRFANLCATQAPSTKLEDPSSTRRARSI